MTESGLMLKGNVISNITAIASAKDFGMALRRDGSVVSWGKIADLTGLTDVKGIAACDFTGLVLKHDGTVYQLQTGYQDAFYGQMHIVEGLSNITVIASGGGENMVRNIALSGDGFVTNWGTETTFKDATPPAGLNDVVAITAGLNHSLALKRDGTVVGWGFNREGQATGAPTEVKPYIASGPVMLDGKILADIVAISANYEYSLALKRDGTVVGWGSSCPKVPLGLRDVVAISAGEGYCLAITTNSLVAERFSHSK